MENRSDSGLTCPFKYHFCVTFCALYDRKLGQCSILSLLEETRKMIKE